MNKTVVITVQYMNFLIILGFSGDPGSPENPRMLKKFIYCTGISTFLFILIYLLMKFEYLNLRNILI